MTIAFLVGRVILGLYWIEVAYNHSVKSAGLIGYTQSAGLKPGTAKLAVWGTGLLALVGALSIGLGVYPTVGIICLVLFLIGVSFKMHAYWKVTDPNQRGMQRVNFTKNLALASAILCLLAVSQPWALSL